MIITSTIGLSGIQSGLTDDGTSRKSGTYYGPPRTPPVKFDPLGRFGSTTHRWKVLANGYNFSKPNVA